MALRVDSDSPRRHLIPGERVAGRPASSSVVAAPAEGEKPSKLTGQLS